MRIDSFQLYLFDFDGLLVNTERLHYQAYVDMLAAQGCAIDWSFAQFCELAHLNSSALREAIYGKFPELDPNWERLYNKKKQHYLELLQLGEIELMPGAAFLLEALDKKGIRRCVATNSPREQISLIRSRIPLLETIPHWITREQYARPKPDPECYLQAIQRFSLPGDRIIGFEDSMRGLQALQGTPAQAVLVCPSHHPLLEMALGRGALHYESFSDIPFEV